MSGQKHDRPNEGGGRYGQSGAGDSRQDQGERKDEGWQPRQGGSQDRAKDVRGHHPGHTPTHQDTSGLEPWADTGHRRTPSQGARPGKAGA